jgi:hypothetical protein
MMNWGCDELFGDEEITRVLYLHLAILVIFWAHMLVMIVSKREKNPFGCHG